MWFVWRGEGHRTGVWWEMAGDVMGRERGGIGMGIDACMVGILGIYPSDNQFII